jgi:hypothetical protein
MLNPNKPVVAASLHHARCTVNAYLAGRTNIDPKIALHDFESIGFNEGAALVRDFMKALNWPDYDAHAALLVRLFRTKLAKRWHAFERDLETARAARQS